MQSCRSSVLPMLANKHIPYQSAPLQRSHLKQRFPSRKSLSPTGHLTNKKNTKNTKASREDVLSAQMFPPKRDAHCEECQHKEHKIVHKHGATTSQPTHDDFHECGFSLDSRRSAHLLLRRPHAMSQEVEPVRVQSMASAMAVVNNRPASTFRSACTRCCAFSSSLSSLP